MVFKMLWFQYTYLATVVYSALVHFRPIAHSFISSHFLFYSILFFSKKLTAAVELLHF